MVRKVTYKGPEQVSVTLPVFQAFVREYPRDLVRDVMRICDPAQVTYYDFTLGEAWDAIVGSYAMESGLERGPPDTWYIWTGNLDAAGKDLLAVLQMREKA